jgi:endonuclease I
MQLYNKNNINQKELKNRIYKTKVIYGDKKHADSFEHVVPRKLLKNRTQICDLHNIFGAPVKENNMRGVKKFSEIKTDTKNWYLHISDRGCVSRAIIYMYSVHNSFNIEDLIELPVLIKWFLQFPPSTTEILHSKVASDYMGYENPLITNYLESCDMLFQGWDIFLYWIHKQVIIKK